MRLIDADHIKIRLCEIADYWRSKGKRYEAVLLNDTVNAVIDSEPTITQPSGEWISVEDRLPDTNGTYIVYAPTYYGGSSSGLDNINGIMFARRRGRNWSIEVGYHKRPNCVTHWMPLPEPPEDIFVERNGEKTTYSDLVKEVEVPDE